MAIARLIICEWRDVHKRDTTVDDEYFPALVDAHRSAEPKVTLVAGGQPGDYAANRVVDLQCALRPARSFYDAGVFGSDVSWVNT